MSIEREKIDQIAGILRVLGHPDRLRILACLMKDSCFVKDLCSRLDLPQSTVSQHLRVMTDRGILISVRDGVKVCYHPADSFAKTIAELIVAICETE
ncbi:MAG TPA: ArsR family transcriptional regulator [candidate division Zixibacteria bacterium]|nr:ArsR family transcriptional regulator [candidate division Zixibacteria bacterium]